MSPVEEDAVYSKGDQGFGVGSSSARGTLLEMDRTPDMHLDAAGPSNMAQLGSESSSEVGRLGNLHPPKFSEKRLAAWTHRWQAWPGKMCWW